MKLLTALARPVLDRLDPETAHAATLMALRAAPLPRPAADDARLAVEAFGLRFPNPLGLAAGADKNGRTIGPMLRLGFGFVEVGTVTLRPQPGNPRPRVFRLREDGAIINRLGFNGDGAAAMAGRLAGRTGGLVGINIGANRDATDRAADYAAMLTRLAPAADYLTVNVSSPNTPGLRDLQGRAALDDLLARVMAARDAAPVRRPVLVKIAPDMTLGALDDIVAVTRARRVDGLIVSNTTAARAAALRSAAAPEEGGLSGRPLFAAATQMLAAAYLRVEGQFPLVGTGGIEDAATALAKIEAGASLLQLYTALAFAGPAVVGDIKSGLLERLTAGGHSSLAALRGGRAGDWAAGRLTRAA